MSNPQSELDLGVDYGWFHIMRPRLLKGLIADVGETAWAVYTIIKAHADHHTGRSFPGQELIGRLVGKSAETVGISTRRLVEAGLLVVEKRGRHLEYRLLEEAPLIDRMSGATAGTADFRYVPAAFATQLASLKRFISEGIPPGHGITINLTVNLVQQGDHGVVNMQTVNLSPDIAERSDMQDLVKKLKMLN
jgi:hypothetical protein